jgi:hypothetical protein
MAYFVYILVFLKAKLFKVLLQNHYCAPNWNSHDNFLSMIGNIMLQYDGDGAPSKMVLAPSSMNAPQFFQSLLGFKIIKRGHIKPATFMN